MIFKTAKARRNLAVFLKILVVVFFLLVGGLFVLKTNGRSEVKESYASCPRAGDRCSRPGSRQCCPATATRGARELICGGDYKWHGNDSCTLGSQYYCLNGDLRCLP